MIATVKDVAMWFGIASIAACVAVGGVCVWALIYDRRQHGRWTWKDDD